MVLALLLLTACEPRCRQAQPWEQVPWTLDDPDDAAHLAAADRAMAAWEQFAEWSAWERVCVDEVVVGERRAQGLDLGGSYSLPEQVLQVSPTVLEPWQTTFHELCHVVDLQAGNLADEHPELFTDAAGMLSAGGYSDRMIPAESFARLCEIGARDVQRWQLTDDACGVPFGWHPLTEQPLTDTDLDALALIQDTVFPQAPRVPWHAPGFALEPGADWELWTPAGWGLADVEASTDHLVVLLRALDPWRSPAGLRLLWLDPHTGAEQHRVDLAADGLFDPSGQPRATMVPGSPQPALRTPGGLWRLTPGAAEPTDRCPDADVLLDGIAWSLDSNAAPQPCALDPGIVPPAAPTAPRPTFPLEQENVGENATWPLISVPAWTGAGPARYWLATGLQWLDDTGRWREQALPWHLAVQDVVPLRDGRHVLLPLWSFSRDVHSLWWTVLLDLDTGELVAPVDPCPAARSYDLAGRDWAVSLDPGQALTVRPVRLHLPTDED